MPTYLKRWFLFILIMISAITCSFTVSAMNNTGLETEKLTAEQKEQRIRSANITLWNKIPEGQTIESFDVNEKGMVAIKFATPNSYVGIYDANGVFQYGYTYTTSGASAIEWDGDNLNIYLIRGNIVYSVNADAKVEDAFVVKENRNNDRYYSNCMLAKKKVKGDLEYRLTDGKHIINWPSVSYAQLIVGTADGEKTVFYDAFENGYESLIPQIVFSLIVASAMLLILIVSIKKLREQTNDPEFKSIFDE